MTVCLYPPGLRVPQVLVCVSESGANEHCLSLQEHGTPSVVSLVARYTPVSW